MTQDQLNPEAIDNDIDFNLKEAAHWFGGWDKLRERIKMLEDNEAEAQFERSQSKY